MTSRLRPRLVAFTREVDSGLVRLEALAQGHRNPAFFWEEPYSDLMFAGFGRAWEHVSSPGPDRIAAAAAAAADVFSRLDRLGDVSVTGPKLVGGFSFAATRESAPPDGANRWDDFPAGSLLLPRLMFARSGGRAWITAVATAGRGAAIDVRHAVDVAVEGLEPFAAETRAAPIHRTGPDDPNGEEVFRALVKQAVAEVESGKLAKVVAARSAHVGGAADLWRTLDALRRRYPTCVTFGVFRGHSVFLGASPELLVELRRGRVTSSALAGTVARGGDELSDARLEDRLRHDPKELAEHQYVVQGLRQALHEAGVEVDPPQSLEIVKLANVQHLSSPGDRVCVCRHEHPRPGQCRASHPCGRRAAPVCRPRLAGRKRDAGSRLVRRPDRVRRLLARRLFPGRPALRSRQRTASPTLRRGRDRCRLPARA